MTDTYRTLTNEVFDRILTEQLSKLSAEQIMAIPGIYEVVSEYFNNDVLETWEQTLEYVQYEIDRTPFGSHAWQLQKQGVLTVHDDVDDMIADLNDNYFAVIELGKQALPEGVQDIRGQIDTEPDRVFAYQEADGDAWLYVGISQVSTTY